MSDELREVVGDLVSFAGSRSAVRVPVLLKTAAYIENHEDAAPASKKIVAVLAAHLHAHVDRLSRLAAERVVKALCTKHPGHSIKVLLPALEQIAKATRNFARPDGSQLVALRWSRCLFEGAAGDLSAQSTEFSRLVKLQSLLLCTALSRQGRIAKQATITFTRILDSVPDAASRYGAVVAKAKEDPYMLVVAGLIAPKLLQTDEKFKCASLELLKGVICARAAVPEIVLANTKLFVAHLTHDDFADHVAPAIDRGLKRSADIALSGAVAVLEGVQLDLSRHEVALVKTLLPQISCTDEVRRGKARAAAKATISRCSETEAQVEVLALLTDAYSGKPTKLAQWEQRASVLETLQSLALAPLSSKGKTKVATTLIAKLVPLVKKEQHDATAAFVVDTITSVAKWCGSPPAELQELFKTSLEDTKTKPPLRLAVLQCMWACLVGDARAAAGPLFKPCLAVVAKTSLAQSASPLESCYAASLALRLVDADASLGASLDATKYWGVMTDTKFFSPKLFAQMTPQVASAYLEFAQRALSDHAAAVGDASIVLTALSYLLVHRKREVREAATTNIDTFLENRGTQSTQLTLIKCLDHVLCEEGDETQLSPGVVQRATIAVGNKGAGSDTSQLALGLLPVCFRACNAPDSFELVLDHLELTSRAFISENTEAIASFIVDNVAATKPRADQKTAGKACSTLVQLDGCESLVSWLFTTSLMAFEDHRLSSVGQTEVNIFHTPEGTLYDPEVSALSEAKVPYLDPNSKDYEDQLWRMQVEQELAAKRGRPAPKKEVKLTSRQRELRNAQLARESEIRATVSELDAAAHTAFVVLTAVFKGNPQALTKFVPRLVATIEPRVASALVGERASSLWVQAATGCLSSRVQPVASALAFASLRLLGSDHVPEDWGSASLVEMVGRTVRSLWTITFEQPPLDVVSFAYCLPLLARTLGSTKFPAEVLEDALVTLSSHADLATSADVPRKRLLDLLVDVILNHSRLAHQASVLTVDVAKSMGKAARGPAELPVRSAELDVLLRALASPEEVLRRTATRALLELLPLPTTTGTTADDARLATAVWLAARDPVAVNADLGAKLWAQAAPPLQFGADQCADLLEALTREQAFVQKAAAVALHDAVALHPGKVTDVVNEMLERYNYLLVEPEPVRDEIGNIVAVVDQQRWLSRIGICTGVAAVADALPGALVARVTSFLVNGALADPQPECRAAALKTGLAVVEEHGQAHVTQLLGIFEGYLDSAATATAAHDIVRESVVVLLGSLAKHLDKQDPKLPKIIETLMQTLSTPSQQVQEAVAKCLPPLIQAIKPQASALLEQQFELLLDEGSYATRRGAAYGLAAVVKGLGILALKQHKVMDRLQAAIEDKKVARYREGALMAFEMLCQSLGRLFEPYVIQVLPHLLVCFGDGNKHVRTATEDAARAIMSKLSGHGVKLVLPALMTALEDDAWRTKQGSAELLGAMAFCAPKQLSTCLPSIVPRLSEVLSDTHAKVQTAAQEALARIASVIKNPEIQAIVPSLMNALVDPAKHTSSCLTTLLETAFVHVIDAPSLALIMPVLERALRDRGADIKKKAAQIIGNMYSLTDPKDLQPYLGAVMPGLRKGLGDPAPEVRGVAAKALRAMVAGLGEGAFPDLVPWMLETLRSDVSIVDRSGAAQGLSEVLRALGQERLAEVLPSFIQATQNPAPYIREGHLLLFVFLPLTFGDDFGPYVGQVIPCVLRGLADLEESVRATSMKAGQRIVENYADAAVELLLPQLEQGLLDDNWRIRESSVQLLGDLLFKISGMSGKKSTASGDDDNFGTEQSHQAMVDAIGEERLSRVLAGLFMMRQDVSLSVRQVSVHVWKVVVHHTVKALRDMLPVLVQLLLSCLGSDAEDKRIVAARTLGELVRKLGERVLPQIFPMLAAGLVSDDDATRQGVCIGLSEIMNSVGREQLLDYVDSLIPAVRTALCDRLPQVREAAATTFRTLHDVVGTRAIEEIIPSLLESLQSGGDGGEGGDDAGALSEQALDGLRHVMAAKGSAVLPFLVPRLVKPPLTAFNARALASLGAVAGPALNRHLPEIMAALLATMRDPEAGVLVREATVNLIRSVDEDGCQELVGVLIASTKDDRATTRAAACELLQEFSSSSQLDASVYSQDIVRALLRLFIDPSTEVISSAWGALKAMTATFDEDKSTHLRHMCSVVSGLADETRGAEVPGFNIPRGLEPLLGLYLDCLLKSPDAKEVAATGLGKLVQLTGDEALKPFITKITGPLIRMLGENSPTLKAAILATLCELLEKSAVRLKPFLPQLQPTCVKALRDSNKQVRVRAARAISHLVGLQREKRFDPFVADLLAGVQQTDGGVQRTMLRTLHAALVRGGQNASEAAKANVQEALLALLAEEDDDLRDTAAAAVSALSRHQSDAELETLVIDTLVAPPPTPRTPTSWCKQDGCLTALAHVIAADGLRVLETYNSEIVSAVVEALGDDNSSVSMSAMKVVGACVRCAASNDGFDEACSTLLQTMGAVLKDARSKEVLVAGITALKNAAKQSLSTGGLTDALLDCVVPVLITVATTKAGAIKKEAERALVHVVRYKFGPDTLSEYAGRGGPGAEELSAMAQRSFPQLAETASDVEDEDELAFLRD
eukprot:m.233245 g.233245  ORF g.233245 m.233245 type:complete len:2622 (-) comp18897_c0_seq2:220-8085(-)